MEIPMSYESAKFLLEVVRYYLARMDDLNVYPESSEAAFLRDLIKRLERRIKRG